LSRTLQLCVVLALAGTILTWQLFVPPIVGLADQGDFGRVLGPLGYAPVPKGPEHKYEYVTRTFVRDANYREPRWEQISSEFIFATIAVTWNRVLLGPGAFDITVFGFTHAVVFLLALARLLYVTRRLAMYCVAWALMLLVLTDVGYVAYWNSLYTEPASCLWFLFLLAEGIDLCRSEQISMGQVLRWNIFAVLWIMAKTQNAALCLPLAAYDLRLAWRSPVRGSRNMALAGVVAICVAGGVMCRSLLPAPRVSVLYDMVFYGILPESEDARSDLKALGLDPNYARYSGTLPWSPGTGVADGAVVNALQANVSSFSLMEFYLRRPARLWRHLQARLPTALSLRPEFCGNFDRSAGRPPGATSNAVALWSRFHKRYLSRIALLLLSALVLVPTGSVVFVLSAGAAACARRWAELGILLATCCLTAFFVAAFGDVYDNVKHQFLFNLLLDACLVFGFVAALHGLRRGGGRYPWYAFTGVRHASNP
jgi:hypothetical protein